MVPTVEGLQFAYALHVLPPGRMGFRRWRWELWHGAALLAAGWCTDRRLAERALRRHAARVAHRIFGLTPPDPAAPPVADGAAIPRGATVRLDVGPTTIALVPRGIEQPRAQPAR